MRPSRLIPALVALALTLAPTALAGSGGLGPVSPASPNAEGINTTYWIITGFVIAIFLLYVFPQIGLWLPQVLYK